MNKIVPEPGKALRIEGLNNPVYGSFGTRYTFDVGMIRHPNIDRLGYVDFQWNELCPKRLSVSRKQTDPRTLGD